jgi:phosphoglycerate dehydrogenase-like enzyme
MTTTVLLLTALPSQAPPLIDHILQHEPQLHCLPGPEGLDDAALAQVEVVLGWRFPKGVCERLTSLRWVCSMAAGVEKLLVPELPAQVPMSRVVDPDQALGMAQYAAAMVLRHARGLVGYELQQRAHDWTRHPMAAARHRVTVLGWGEVGREVGRRLEVLGFPVRGWRRDGTPLRSVLAETDIVINTLPLTPQTHGLLDAAAFAALPRGSYLINIARGGHVVEADLIAAVRSGHLAGAALDVQQHEPLPADDPLWAVPGITVTPHIASQPDHATVATQFVEGLRRLRRGEPLPHLVDRARGY